MDADYDLVTSPYATPQDLQRIADARPDLHQVILQHPACYPELAAWINQTQPAQAHYPGDQLSLNTQPADPQSVELPVRPSATPMPHLSPVEGTTAGRRKGKIIAAALVGVGLLAGIGGAAWWFLAPTQDQPQETALSRLPQLQAAVDLSTLGKQERIVPLNADPAGFFLSYGDQLLLGLQSSDVEGVDTEAGATDGDVNSAAAADGPYTSILSVPLGSEARYPNWAIQVPTASVSEGCAVEGSLLTCGSGVTERSYDLAGGAPLPAVPHPDPEAGGSSEADDSAEADASDPAEEDTAATDGGAETDSGTEDESASFQSDFATSVPLNSPDGPYRTDGANLLSQGGAVVDSDLPIGDYWGLQVGQSDNWVISQGTVLLGVTGTKVVWRDELPDGSAALNGFTPGETPRWVLEGNTLVIGSPQGVSGLDALSGDVQWLLEGGVDSWSTSGTELVVLSDNTLSVLGFPEESTEDAAEDGGEESGVEPVGPAPVILPTATEIGMATLEISESCANWGDVGPYDAVEFRDGEAGVGDGYGSVTQTGIGYTVLNGEPTVLVALFCTGGGTGYFSDLGMYNADLERIGTVDYYRGLPWMHNSAGPIVQGLKVVGNTLTFSTQGLQVVESGGGRGWGSLPSNVTMMWDGTEFVVTDVSYSTDFGVVRPPDLDEVRWIYRQIAEENDEAVRDFFTPGFFDRIEFEKQYGSDYDSPFVRSWWYPVDGEIAGCMLIPPLGVDARPDPNSDLYAPGDYSWGQTWDGHSIQEGDFLCALDWSPNAPRTGAIHYDLWWLVRTDEDGTPFVYGEGRTFS